MAATLFWALVSGDMMLQANQPSNEVFMNLLTAWGFGFWVRAEAEGRGWRYYALGGLLLGGATLIKPVLLTVGSMAAGALLAGKPGRRGWKDRVKRIGWVLLPGLALWAVTVLYFVAQGRGGPMYDCLVRYGKFYVGNRSDLTNSHPGQHRVKYFDRTDPRIDSRLHGFSSAPDVVDGLGNLERRSGRRISAGLIFGGYVFGTFLAVSIPGLYFAHYYQLYLPILSIGAGWGLAGLMGFWRNRALSIGMGAATVGLLLWHEGP